MSGRELTGRLLATFIVHMVISSVLSPDRSEPVPQDSSTPSSR